MSKRKKSHPVRAIARRDCRDCGGMGWVYVRRAAIPGGSVTQGVKRCSCIRLVDFSRGGMNDGKSRAFKD